MIRDPASSPLLCRAQLIAVLAAATAAACAPPSETPLCPLAGCPADGAAGSGNDGGAGGADGGSPRDRAGVPPGLVAVYDFDEGDGTVAIDSSGNFYNGGLIGAVGWAQGRSGPDTSFSGGYVVLPPGMLDQARELTLAAWVRVRTNDRIWQRIFDFGRGTGSYFFLTHRSATDTLRFAITRAGYTNEQILEASGPLAVGVWKHVAVVLTAGPGGTLYVDGVPVATNAVMTLRPADVGPMAVAWLGRSEYVTDAPLDGEIDQVRIYARALSAAEIAGLAAAP